MPQKSDMCFTGGEPLIRSSQTATTEILKYFEDRYGTEILSAPPNSGTNTIVWITPFILISLSFIIFSGWLKKSVKGNS